ncbi:MAG: restriction endonuclease [Elusimicrobiota bacterium]|jgi:hypothetical protein
MTPYNFESLSPYDFEILIRDLLQAERRITFESFRTGRDGGIDFRYAPNTKHRVIVQAKHFASSGWASLRSHLKREELPKIHRLKPKRYLLTTSVPLSRAQKDQLHTLLAGFCRSTADIYGREDLNNLIRKFPEIERRNFKLWLTSSTVLERILHAKVFNQSVLALEGIRRKVRYYVQNRSFFDAKSLLKNRHCCIIAGIPGIGKTTLAEILLVDHVTRGYEVYKIGESLGDALEVYRPTRKQLFFYDDFLGQVAIKNKLVKNEDQTLVDFMGVVSRSSRTRFILTTREFILHQAQNIYEKLSDNTFSVNRYVLNLSAYTRFDRAKILFNHIHFSELPATYKAALLEDKNYMAIIDHENFSPRIIDWMTDHARLMCLSPGSYFSQFLQNLDNPEALWAHAFRHQLSNEARDLLLLMGSMPHEVLTDDLHKAFLDFHQRRAERYRFVCSPQDFRRALKELEGNFIQIALFKDCHQVSFHNPSVRDFIVTYLKTDRDEILELAEAAVFFEQLTILWAVTLPAHEREKSEFTKSAVRCFESENLELHNFWYGPKDMRREKMNIGFENRFRSLLMMAGDCSVKEECLPEIHRLFEIVKKRICKRGGRKSEIIDLLAQEQFMKPIYRDIYDEALDLAKNYFLNSLDSVEDYEKLLKLAEKVPELLSKLELDESKTTFIGMYEEDIESVLNDEDAKGWAGNYASSLKYVAHHFNIDVKEDIEKLEEHSQGAWEPDDDQQMPSVQHDGTSLSDIHAMFDSLGKGA